jgi:hypothetical protein
MPNETSVWIELAKAAPSVVTAITAIVGVYIAKAGLEKWRSETWGKRKAEVAETTLANVYEMEGILRSARVRVVLSDETKKKDGVPDELATNPNYAPEARLLAHQEFFGRFRSQKYAFAAVFGRDAAKPLDELWQIRLKINLAVFDLVNNKEMSKSRDTAQRTQWGEWYYTAFGAPGENDETSKLISRYVSAIEETCRPAIEARAKTR